MALYPLTRPQFFKNDGTFASGYQLFFYEAGTTTKKDTFDGEGGATNPNPIILNSRGEPDNAGTPIDIFLSNGQPYKIVFTTDTDTDPPTGSIWVVDNVTSGVAGSIAGDLSSMWINATAATRTTTTSFTIAGADVTSYFTYFRRVYCSGSGIDRYGTIISSVYGGTDTVVTLTDIIDGAGTPASLDLTMDTASVLILEICESCELNGIIGIFKSYTTTGDGSADGYGFNIKQDRIDAYEPNNAIPISTWSGTTGRINAIGLITSSDTLIPNDVFDFSTDGWTLVDGTAPTTPISTAYDAIEDYNYIILADNVSTYAYGSKSIRLSGGTISTNKYRVEIKAKHSGGAGYQLGLRVSAYQKNIFAEPITSVNRDSEIVIVDNAVLTFDNTWQTKEFILTTSANWFNIAIANTTDAAVDWYIAEIEVTPVSNTGYRGALAYSSTDVSIPYNTLTTVAFDLTSYDNALYGETIHSNSTNNERLTVPSGTKFVRIFAQVVWEPSTLESVRRATIYKNGGIAYQGGAYQDIRIPPVATGTYQSFYISTAPIIVTAGDYFDLRVFFITLGAATPLDLMGGATADKIYFGMELLD